MGKKKAAIAVGLCVAIGLCGAGLAACGGKGGGTPSHKAGDRSDYYVVGEFSCDTLKDVGWNSGNSALSDILEEQSLLYTDTANQYSITLDLYAGDQFKVIQLGQGWNFKITGDTLDSSITDGYVTGGGGVSPDDWNFQIQNSGNYTFTFTVTADEKKTTYVRNGDAPRLPVAVNNIQLNKSAVVLELGVKTEFQLEATVLPADADDKDNVTYESEDEDVATVSETGKVTAVAKGKTTIYVSCGGKEVEFKVTVINEGESVPAEEVTINKETLTLHVNQKETLVATVAPEETTDEADWTSSDPTVVSVDDEGKLEAKAPGTATITVTYGEKSKTCVVTVPRDYYVVGESKNAIFPGWNPANKFEDIKDGGLFVAGENKSYSLTIDLNEGTKLKILTLGGVGGDAWGGALGYGDLADEDTDKNVNLATQLANDGGNIQVLVAGKYQIDLVYDTTTEKYSIEMVRKGDAVIVWNYDIYVHNGVDGSPWKDVRLGTATLDKDHLTLTGDWVVDADSVNNEFGIITAHKGTTGQTGWGGKDKLTVTAVADKIDMTGNNAKVLEAGTYNITVTLNADGEFESVVFNSFTAA